MIVENNYAVNAVMAEGPESILIEDVLIVPSDSAHIGDWYEQAEGIFYRPIGTIPPDSPLNQE
jgi:hypothetical protein